MITKFVEVTSGLIIITEAQRLLWAKTIVTIKRINEYFLPV
jgi:hypothetical protein